MCSSTEVIIGRESVLGASDLEKSDTIVMSFVRVNPINRSTKTRLLNRIEK